MTDTATDQVAYHVVFDIVEVGYRQWWFGAAGLILVAVGLLLVLFNARVAPRWPTALRLVFGWFFLGFSVLWTLGVLAITYFEYARLLHAVQSGEVGYVEGPVEDFVAMPYTGHAMESFSVQGKTFEYSDFVVTAGFNNTRSHGGPITEGRRVRVGYVGDTIVRLEVAEGR